MYSPQASWQYLYRAVNSSGQLLDVRLSTQRDTKAAKRFRMKALKARHTQMKLWQQHEALSQRLQLTETFKQEQCEYRIFASTLPA